MTHTADTPENISGEMSFNILDNGFNILFPPVSYKKYGKLWLISYCSIKEGSFTPHLL